MNALFSQATFAGFGPCALDSESAPRHLERIHGSKPLQLKRQLREHCPRQPGVYGMLDPHGDLVYVGKAKNLRARLMCYFRPRSRDPKAARIINHARCILWEPCSDEFAALHRELELIRRWRPRFNVQGQPDSGQLAYVCLGRQPAPYAYLAPRPPSRILAHFGPLPAGRRAREAMRWFNDWFKLRDCPQTQAMIFADQADLFPTQHKPGCLRLELATCLGPCAGGCSRMDYTGQVRAARAFLAGEDVTPLAQLEGAMKEASAQLIYERAAVLRDKWTALTWLHRQLQRMRHADKMDAFIYPVTGHDGLVRWYLLCRGRAVAALPATAQSLDEHTASVLAALAEDRSRPAKPAERVAAVILLAAWFRKHPGERQALIPLQAAGCNS